METKKIKNIRINQTDYAISGDSAFEIAQAQGFEGSVEEWLQSLKGKDGLEVELAQNLGQSKSAAASQRLVTTCVTALEEDTNALGSMIVGVMAEVEEIKDQVGLLIADRTVNARGTSWRVPSNALPKACIVKLGTLSKVTTGEVVNLVPIEKLPDWNDTGITVEALGNNRYRFNGSCNAGQWGAGFAIEDYDNSVTASDGETWYTSAELISGSASTCGSFVSPQANAHYHNCVYLPETVGEVSVGSTTFAEMMGCDFSVAGVWLQFEDGATFTDAVYEFRVGREKSEPATVPSVITAVVSGSTRIPIPAAVQALPGYGHGIDLDCYNHIDVENGVYVKMCEYTEAGGLVQVSTKNFTLPADFATKIAEPIPITAGGSVTFEGGEARFEIDYQVRL